MSVKEIKLELMQLIEKETDLKLLEAVHTLLLRSEQIIELRSKLTSRALKAEEDIIAGKVYTTEEVKLKTSR